MIVVHHLEQSRSQRVLWLLEELNLPYTIERYQRDPQTMLAPPELKRVHPLGKSPVVVDDGLVLAESGAISETMLARHGQGRLQPKTEEQAVAYRYWLHAAEGSYMPPLLMGLVMGRMVDPAIPQPMKAMAKPVLEKATQTIMESFVRPQLAAQYAYLEDTLSRQPWLAGDDFTAADIQMSFPIEAAHGRAGLGQNEPHVLDWLARIQARPAYQVAREKAGAGPLR